MCGIVGIVTDRSNTERNQLDAAANKLYHRGPDYQGVWWSDNGCIGFGHRRLSVIDLNPAANQPMINSDNSAVITFNGEIYNFKSLRNQLEKLGHYFSTQSDTEVLLVSYQQWGKDCLQYLDGMFAFAIFDKKNNQIFFARDRSGEKPLYFYHHEKNFLFASEIKAFFEFSFFEPRLNLSSLEFSLLYGYLPSGQSVFLNTSKLLPGQYAIFDISTFSLTRHIYWYSNPQANNENIHENQLLEQFEHVLSESVANQLFADVPVGILLSGGVDSSIITALAARYHKNLNTYTVTFKGWGHFNEAPYAEMVSNYFGTQHHEISVDEINPDSLSIIAAQLDEPMFDSSCIPMYYVTKSIKSKCTVALGGDGADEVMGGYQNYKEVQQFESLYSLISHFKIDLLSKNIFEYLPVGFKGKRILSFLSADYKNSLPILPTFFDEQHLKNYFKPAISWPQQSCSIRKAQIRQNVTTLQRAILLDFEQYLAEDILVKSDRMSMINAVELRSPFLGKNVLEFSSRLPDYLKADRHSSKILLRKLATKILPPQFDVNRKQGFSIPLQQWLHLPKWRNYFMEILLDSASIYDKKNVMSLFDAHTRGRSNNERLYALVMLELWRKHYSVSFS